MVLEEIYPKSISYTQIKKTLQPLAVRLLFFVVIFNTKPFAT